MSEAPSVGSGRPERLVAAARAAIGRFEAADDLDPELVFAEIGECLFWLIALADNLGAKDDLIVGLRWPRNRIAHGQLVAAPTGWSVAGVGLLGWGLLGSGLLGGGGPTYVWVSRDQVPLGPRDWPNAAQEEAYDAEVAGRSVHEILRRALTLLDGDAPS